MIFTIVKNVDFNLLFSNSLLKWLCHDNLHFLNQHFLVASIIFDKSQNYVAFSTEKILNKVVNIPILLIEEDFISWKDDFTPSIKYFHREYVSNLHKIYQHKAMWHKKFALKYALFSQLCMMDGLKTFIMLATRHISQKAIYISLLF